MQLKVIETNDPKVVETIGRLRAEVWRSEDTIEFHEFGDADCWLDDYDFDPGSLHWAVYHEGELIAAARLSLHEQVEDAPYGHLFKEFCPRFSAGRVASINRLVVKKPFRGRHIATLLDQLRIRKAKELGATEIVALPVGDIRTRVLQKLGYEIFASELDPAQFGIKIKNAKLAVLGASLSEEAVGRPPQAPNLRVASSRIS